MTDFSQLCNSCSKQGCCTDSAVPLVFPHDLKNLKNINKNNKKFLKKIFVNEKEILAIKKKKESTECVFWNTESKQCDIYQQRPFDCKAYPFDILKVGRKYCWIVYSCNPSSDWSWSETYLQNLEKDPAFTDIIKNIEIFEGHTEMILPNEAEKTPYVVLREINYNNTN